MCQSCCGWGQEAELKSHGRAGGRTSDSWKGSFSPFVPPEHGSVSLTSLCRAISPRCCCPISSTLPTCLYSVHLSLPASLCPAFLLLLCPSLSACLPPPPLFLLLLLLSSPYPLSPHDINRKGRLCSPREIYCSFKKKNLSWFFLCSSQWASRLGPSSTR